MGKDVGDFHGAESLAEDRALYRNAG
jgi:hypothetical protein